MSVGSGHLYFSRSNHASKGQAEISAWAWASRVMGDSSSLLDRVDHIQGRCEGWRGREREGERELLTVD